MPATSFWRPKLRTASAMARLCWAQLLVSWIPFERWRNRLGSTGDRSGAGHISDARYVAADVVWAAKRLPLAVKCLPQAMALSWSLRRRSLRHTVVIAVRPDQLRQSPDALHAWVEVEGERILGDLPGPWIETFSSGG